MLVDEGQKPYCFLAYTSCCYISSLISCMTHCISMSFSDVLTGHPPTPLPIQENLLQKVSAWHALLCNNLSADQNVNLSSTTTDEQTTTNSRFVACQFQIIHAKKHLLVRNMCIINAFTAGLGFMHVCTRISSIIVDPMPL